EGGRAAVDHWRHPPDQEEDRTIGGRSNTGLEIEIELFLCEQFARLRFDQYRHGFGSDALVEGDLLEKNARPGGQAIECHETPVAQFGREPVIERHFSPLPQSGQPRGVSVCGTRVLRFSLTGSLYIT